MDWYYDEYDYGYEQGGESWSLGQVTITYNDNTSKMAPTGAVILAGVTVTA